MFKRILLSLLAVVLLFAGYVATRPSEWRIVRSGHVAAPPSEVYPRIVDFRRWEAWSPWATLDPTMKITFDGQPGSPGSSYHWKGNEKVGEGQMTILTATPDRDVSIKLEFVKPWPQVSTTDFHLEPAGDGTQVTWSMYGTHDFVGKLAAVFMNMDKLVGGDFEKGLAKMARTQPR